MLRCELTKKGDATEIVNSSTRIPMTLFIWTKRELRSYAPFNVRAQGTHSCLGMPPISGQQGQLETGSGHSFSLNGVTQQVKTKVCGMALEHAKSLL